MSDEIEPTDDFEIVSDGQGLALFGDKTAIEQFLAKEGLASREIDLPRWTTVVGNTSSVTSGVINSASQIGRWVKVSEKSAAAMKGAKMMTGSEAGLSRAIVTGSKSRTKHIIEIVQRGDGLKQFANPAALAGVAGIMTQIALQQAMDEIADYLKTIDAKVDDVLQAQKDSVVADMLGVGLVVDEALTLRDKVGRVSEVTWSKVQATTFQLARTQAYALLQLDGIVKKLESEGSIATLLKTVQGVLKHVEDWLVVLARCSQLLDAVSVIELDRLLLDASEDLEDHRSALSEARHKRLEMISQTVEKFQTRLDAVAKYANSKLLLNPFESPAIITACNQLSEMLGRFQAALELEQANGEFLSRLWGEVAAEFRDDVLNTSKKLAVGAVGASKTAAKKGAKWVAVRVPKGKKKGTGHN